MTPRAGAEWPNGKHLAFLATPYVREIVRVAKNSHGGDLPKCPQGPDLSGFIAGAARGIRTPDPVITNDVLYQLSYCGGFRRS
jgi:hypothetical protein